VFLTPDDVDLIVAWEKFALGGSSCEIETAAEFVRNLQARIVNELKNFRIYR
jgi:hypothetical protein